MNGIAGSAEISACGRYRYELRRTWDTRLRPVSFVMLNPSTADAAEDDPTIRRCIGFARSWGFGELRVYNLFALRAKDPRALADAAEYATKRGRYDEGPVGPDNDTWLVKACECRMVVCAWGSLYFAFHRAVVVTSMFQALLASPAELRCLGINADGMPKHPLYLRGDAKPVPFKMVRLGPGGA